MATRKTPAKNKTAEQPSTLLETALKECPYVVDSIFEQENFYNKTGPAYGRYVIELVNKIRKIDSDLKIEKRDYESARLRAERDSLVELLEKEDEFDLKDAMDNWQLMEADYWVNALGKQAAIEILTIGKTSADTMAKMVKLPEELYVKATQICVRLANAIMEATQNAEEEIGYVSETQSNIPQAPPTEVKLTAVKPKADATSVKKTTAKKVPAKKSNAKATA